MTKTLDAITDRLLRLSGVAIFLLLWETAPRVGWIDPYFAPPFTTVLRAFGRLAEEGTLASHLLVSAWRGLSGLAVAVAIGVPAGFLLGRRFPRVGAALEPLLQLLSQVNPFTLLPLFLLFFGIGETAKVAVIGWVSLWPILFYTVTAVRTVDPLLVKTARALGVGGVELYRTVLFPGGLPTIFTGVRIGTGLVFFMLVAAEMLGANAGVGWLVHNSAMNFQIPQLYAGAAAIIFLGYALNRGLLTLEQGLFDWREAPSEAVSGRPARPALRPGKGGVVLVAVLLALLFVVGGWETRRVNLAAVSGGHSHHGTHGPPTPERVEEEKRLEQELNGWDPFADGGKSK
ncbi:ABC transporter permease [Geobacter pickeringii]|uniref:ABC transporter permease n=1 Tax=Geobacter pickeringii TaxID=345632 RepID=UPI000A004E4C|nr:ABC transporter permease [Geobacter pickeringii]